MPADPQALKLHKAQVALDRLRSVSRELPADVLPFVRVLRQCSLPITRVRADADLDKALTTIARHLIAHSQPSSPRQNLPMPKATMVEFWQTRGWMRLNKASNQLEMSKPDWSDESTRLDAIRFLVRKVLQTDPRKVKGRDFRENNLRSLLANYYGDSTYTAISKAYPELNIKEWEMAASPSGLWINEETRAMAIRWLVEVKLAGGKDIRALGCKDFRKHGLGGLLYMYFSNSPYKAISFAYPELGIRPWEMASTPPGFFDAKENRVSAVKWLIEVKSEGQLDPKGISIEDFVSNGLRGLMDHYSSSPYAAISEAYPELGIRPWEMGITPQNFFKRKPNRVKAVRWLVRKLEKDPRDMHHEDFTSNGLSSLIAKYHSTHAAISEAYPELGIKPWEMLETPRGFWLDAANRHAAVRWLVEARLGGMKDVKDICYNDFNSSPEQRYEFLKGP